MENHDLNPKALDMAELAEARVGIGESARERAERVVSAYTSALNQRTPEEISVWAKEMADRCQQAADKAIDEDAKVVLRAKAGTWRFISNRVLDDRPLKVY